MSYDSIGAVKDAIEDGEFHGNVDVAVSCDKHTYIYKNIYVSIYYHVGYMQMNVDISWDDDVTQPRYSVLGLHAGYNTNFQEFSYDAGYLMWYDNKKRISIKF